MKKEHFIILITIFLTSFFHAQKKGGKEGIFEDAFTHGNFSDNISFEIKTDFPYWTKMHNEYLKTMMS